MSEDSSSVDVSEKVKALEKEYTAFRAASARSRTTRLIILLGAVALVIVIGFMFYSLASEVMSKKYQDNLLAIAKERLEKNRDDYLKEVRGLVEHSAPILKDAFYKQTKKDMPKYTEAFAKEREAFAKNVEETLRNETKEHYGEAIEKYKAQVIAEIPELDTPELKEKAMQAVGDAFDKLVEKYYVDVLADGMEDIYGSWDKFPEAAESGESAAEDVLIGLMLQLVSKKMAN